MQFDQQLLERQLSNLDPRRRALFSICCAERLHPAYESFLEAVGSAGGSSVRSYMASIWTAIEKSTVPTSSVADPELFGRLVPADDVDGWKHQHAFAQDAIIAMQYAGETARSGAVSSAASAAAQCYNLADFSVSSNLTTSGPELESKILLAPLMQSEVRWLTETLARVESVTTVDWKRSVIELRADTMRSGQLLRRSLESMKWFDE